MSSGLLIFRSLADDAQSGLTEILARLSRPVSLTQMFREGRVYGRPYLGWKWVSANRATLGVAARSPVGREFRVLKSHANSLRRPRWRSTPVEIKRHHYQGPAGFASEAHWPLYFEFALFNF
jgi:hypothetical protein